MPMSCSLKVQAESSCTERNPIGRRTQSDWTADANGEKSLGCVSLEMPVEPKINPEVHFYWASGRIFMLFAVLPDSNN